MDLYTATAYDTSRRLTMRYSSSFGISSRFFGKSLQPHIYAIYGLVRIADEIVDTYQGSDAGKLLDELEVQTRTAVDTGFSSNLAVHAFAATARRFGIPMSLVEPFFHSMRMDLPSHRYHPREYQDYIYGSAEVVGLMCLHVFINGDNTQYDKLAEGARLLGSAYQKVNFLRDLRDDHERLGRMYFPDVAFESFDDAQKDRLVGEIRQEFDRSAPFIDALPRSSRKAVHLSHAYYRELLDRLAAVPAGVIKSGRLRVSTPRKLFLLAKASAQGKAA